MAHHTHSGYGAPGGASPTAGRCPSPAGEMSHIPGATLHDTAPVPSPGQRCHSGSERRSPLPGGYGSTASPRVTGGC